MFPVVGFEGSGLVGRFGKGWLDKGYEVIEGIAKGWEIKKPKKKPKGRDLTEEERVELLAGLVNMEQMRRMGMEWVM